MSVVGNFLYFFTYVQFISPVSFLKTNVDV